MRKMTALFVTICLCFILCSCGTKKADNNTQEQRLEGYYLNPLTGERYCFEITEHGSGDYGGTLTDLSDTTNVSVWSIEDGTVYINGQAMYIYDGTSLYKDGDIAVGLKHENNAITGVTPPYWCVAKEKADTDSYECYFSADGTVEFYHYDKMILDESTSYTLSNGIVYVADASGSYYTDVSLYIYNDQLFFDILIPI